MNLLVIVLPCTSLFTFVLSYDRMQKFRISVCSDLGCAMYKSPKEIHFCLVPAEHILK